MGRLTQVFVTFVFCSVISLNVVVAENPEIPSSEKGDLYSDDEKEVLIYLRINQIPPVSEVDTTAPSLSFYLPRIARALHLFKLGSSELRLAVAKSLRWAPEKEILAFWEECDADDIQARHYLAGIALANVSKDKKKELRIWLLEEADVKYATALLKNLSQAGLLDETEEAEKEEIYIFLKELYKQQGVVVKYKGSREDFTISGSVQAYVVLLLPRTERAFDILLEWMVADSRKTDEGTLEAMWGRWQTLQSSRPPLKGKQFFEDAARVPDLAESWLRSPRRHNIADGREARREFSRNLWSQVFNPDHNVREAAIKYLLDYQTTDEAFDFIKKLDIPVSQRQQAMIDVEKILSELKESEKYKDEKRASALDKRYQQLNDALNQ